MISATSFELEFRSIFYLIRLIKLSIWLMKTLEIMLNTPFYVFLFKFTLLAFAVNVISFRGIHYGAIVNLV